MFTLEIVIYSCIENGCRVYKAKERWGRVETFLCSDRNIATLRMKMKKCWSRKPDYITYEK
jgi:hypothetical protein